MRKCKQTQRLKKQTSGYLKENEGGRDKFKSLDLIYIIPYKRDSQQGHRCTKGVQHSCNNLYGEKNSNVNRYMYM